MGHELIKSKLIRGLSAFDPAVILDGPEANYIVAIERFSGHFVSTGLVTSSDKAKIVSQYWSFVTEMRVENVPEYEDWVRFIFSHHELHCRPDLLQLYKLSCLCLPSLVEMSPEFFVPIPGLESDRDVSQSCKKSLQMSYLTIQHVSSLYRDPKSVSRVFRLLGRETDLLADKKFSV